MTELDSVQDTGDDRSGILRPLWTYTVPGLATGLVFACLSFTPSLLPRPPLFQALVAGVDLALGYGIGVIGAWVWRAFADRTPRTPRPRAWWLLSVAALVLIPVSVVLGVRWQTEAHKLAATDPDNPTWMVLVLPVAVLLAIVLVALGRGIRWVYRTFTGFLARMMGARAAKALGVVVLAGGSVLLVSGVLWDAALASFDGAFSVSNQQTPGRIDQPTGPLRSGSEESLGDWDTRGREGRVFVGSGPTADEIADLTGEPALEPIRAYSGLESAEDAEERADLAVDDLERAGGFDRESLLVVTTTGTGWVEPSAAMSFEYLTGGDSAMVSMQYSYLPSWLSFMVDSERAREAGRQLFDTVYERWLGMPVGERPKLYVFGESLGSFGAETAFSGEHDMATRTSGALFVGPPNFNPLYRSFIDERDSASPEIRPVYREGRVVRFSNHGETEVAPLGAEWREHRVVYLQHASDPVVWWSPDLILRRPDWLAEPRGDDVPDSMRWMPLVTFWQMSADLALSFSTAPGHGHNYTGEHAAAWAAILQPEGWSKERVEELRDLVLVERGFAPAR
ncbi:MAG: alpha/beta-hydrolase family protein [Nocardioides sp.]|nr:alpha/beta-hydrolase family protein [Nocardioides sp.]